MRSRTTQAWLKEHGIDYPLIEGGYKAMRNFLLQQLEISIQQIPFTILSGLTGSGKTRVLTRRVAYRIATGSADGSHTVVLTFTREAAGELDADEIGARVHNRIHVLRGGDAANLDPSPHRWGLKIQDQPK